MKNRNSDTYTSDRLKPKIEWYDKKAVRAKRQFFIVGLLQVVLLAFVPVINAFARHNFNLIYVSSVLAAFAAICGSIVIFSNLRQNWTRYRNVHGQLENLLILKENGIKPFNRANADKLFIENCETVMNDEREIWDNQVSKEH